MFFLANARGIFCVGENGKSCRNHLSNHAVGSTKYMIHLQGTGCTYFSILEAPNLPDIPEVSQTTMVWDGRCVSWCFLKTCPSLRLWSFLSLPEGQVTASVPHLGWHLGTWQSFMMGQALGGCLGCGPQSRSMCSWKTNMVSRHKKRNIIIQNPNWGGLASNCIPDPSYPANEMK